MSNRSGVVSRLVDLGYTKAANRYADCDRWTARMTCGSCAKSSRIPLRCKLRICEGCAKRYAHSQVMKWEDILVQLNAEGKMKAGYTLKLLTLTLAHNGTMADRVIRIKQCFNRLWRTEFAGALNAGALIVIEISGSEHVHLHALVYGPFKNTYDLSAKWKEITGDSFILKYEVLRKGSRIGIRYVLKYLSKGLASEDEQTLADKFDAMSKQRRIWTKGIFYNPRSTYRVVTVCPWCVTEGDLHPNWQTAHHKIKFRVPVYYAVCHDPPDDEPF